MVLATRLALPQAWQWMLAGGSVKTIPPSGARAGSPHFGFGQRIVTLNA
jgi:hypothetical protein